ncbi:MAG: hypothetical protein ACREEE_02015 [Dongiaceae bacterium]
MSGETAVMSDHDSDQRWARRRRAKNRALLLALLAFVALVYVVSIVRMGGG